MTCTLTAFRVKMVGKTIQNSIVLLESGSSAVKAKYS